MSMGRPTVAGDGRSFVAEGKPYAPFGVNYYRPGTGWAPQVWKMFDPAATAADFEILRDLGANCVRVFLTFASFTTEQGGSSSEGFDKLDAFLDIAEEHDLYVHPTGPDHWEGLPSWAQTDRIADDIVLDALERFWAEASRRYRARDALFAYDLLNEPAVGWDTDAMRPKWGAWILDRYGSVPAAAKAWGIDPGASGEPPVPPPEPAPGSGHLLDYQRFRESIADEWTRRQTVAIREGDPDALVTVGAIQWAIPYLLPSLPHYAAFRPSRQAEFLDFLSFHFYPLAEGMYQYEGAAARDANLAYVEAVAREVAAPGKPVVVGEFGWYGGGSLPIRNGQRTREATEQDQAEWCAGLIDATRGFAAGWLNWGMYDQPEATDVSALTGLLTADGVMKEWGRTFESLAAGIARGAPGTETVAPRFDWDRFITDTEAARAYRAENVDAYRAAR